MIAALHRDPQLAQHSGKTLIAPEVARDYGTHDGDGRQPALLRGIMGQPHPAFS